MFYDYDYQLDSESLDEVSEEKDLGVTITCDLRHPSSVLMLTVKRILGVTNRSIDLHA